MTTLLHPVSGYGIILGKKFGSPLFLYAQNLHDMDVTLNRLKRVA